jgi:hypothetical protein
VQKKSEYQHGLTVPRRSVPALYSVVLAELMICIDLPGPDRLRGSSLSDRRGTRFWTGEETWHCE